MTSCSKSEVRRCRPLLGTFVEITASGPEEAVVQKAVTAAFEACDRIQKLMSVHDADSEVSLLNREAAKRPVTVSRDTFTVLRRADKLAAESGGAFDYTVAPTLARWGLLPAALKRKHSGGWRHVLLLRERKVLFLYPVALDLGGIAKGFAVDRAVEVLRAHGVTAGVVNAGGDLRAFGAEATTIHLRHPGQPQQFAGQIPLQEAAFATSSPCFTEAECEGERVSHLVDTLKRRAITGVISVSVRAKECWLADALTKVVLNAPKRAETLLAKYNAEAFMLRA